MNKVIIRQVGSKYLVGVEPVIGEPSGDEKVYTDFNKMMDAVACLFNKSLNNN